MAFYDWNKDGKKDVQDDWLEYNIYKKAQRRMILIVLIILHQSTIPAIHQKVFRVVLGRLSLL